jgi:hypothetical protein
MKIAEYPAEYHGWKLLQLALSLPNLLAPAGTWCSPPAQVLAMGQTGDEIKRKERKEVRGQCVTTY